MLTHDKHLVLIPKETLAHLEAHPETTPTLLRSALERTCTGEPNGKVVSHVVEMGRVIGRNICVETHRQYWGLFARRIGRRGPTHVVQRSFAPECTKMVLVLSGLNRECWKLLTAYVGETAAPREPWDASIGSRTEFERCLEFWTNHALIWDESTMGPTWESNWARILRGGQNAF